MIRLRVRAPSLERREELSISAAASIAELKANVARIAELTSEFELRCGFPPRLLDDDAACVGSELCTGDVITVECAESSSSDEASETEMRPQLSTCVGRTEQLQARPVQHRPAAISTEERLHRYEALLKQEPWVSKLGSLIRRRLRQEFASVLEAGLDVQTLSDTPLGDCALHCDTMTL